MAVVASANQHWIWGFGFVSGASLAIMVGVREFPPGYITNWQDGAQGEEWTAKELRPLAKQGWTVMHDLRDRRGDGKGNFDHVLVGPSGVFLLDSKAWPGVTTIDKGLPTLRRHEDPDLPANVYEALPGRQKAAATRLKRVLSQETKISVWVTPVVVIWGGFPEGTVEADGVTFIRGILSVDGFESNEAGWCPSTKGAWPWDSARLSSWPDDRQATPARHRRTVVGGAPSWTAQARLGECLTEGAVGVRGRFPGHARSRIFLSAASARSPASGRVPRYCWVVVICLCPSRSLTTCRSAPPASSQEA